MNAVVGHQQVREHFSRLLAEGGVHHAWLLAGMQGIGKHTLAMDLARRYLCEQQEACGRCHACRLIASGAHPDVMQISPAEKKRDISIEQVRTLLDFLNLSGMESTRRVVVLDDAERMNRQAANALLKGLEEPATGSLLLLVSHQPALLPATVRSRCLIQYCSPLDEADTSLVLQRLGIKAGFIDLAADLSEGCPGRVACMADEEVAAALSDWRELLNDVAKADIGAVEGWLQNNESRVPRELIVRILIRQVQQRQDDWPRDMDMQRRLHQALWQCARWPADVLRHSLRPVPALLASILALRAVLRTA